MIVLDASLALDIATSSRDGVALRDRLVRDGRMLVAPEVIDLEMLQALRRLVREKRFTVERAQDALENLDALEIERFRHRPLAARIWALRDNLTAYDAAYFALAEFLDAPLWTRDAKYQSVPGHQAHVVVI